MNPKWIVEHRREVLSLGDLEIIVKGDCYNGWTLLCVYLDIYGTELSSNSFEDARAESLGLVAEKLQAGAQRYRELHERVIAVINGDGGKGAVHHG